MIQDLRFFESQPLCPYSVLLEYLNRTRAVREPTGVSNLFLSYVKQFQPTSTDSCARWLNMVPQFGPKQDIIARPSRQ